MKTFIVLGLLMFLYSRAQALDAWISSNTATTDSMKVLCGGGQKAILHGVCSNYPVASSTMTFANSSYTITGVSIIKVSSLNVSHTECFYYDASFPGGLIYDKYLEGDVTILYACY